MYACICMRVYLCVCMFVCMYVCMYICVYAYMYMYVCIIHMYVGWGIVRGEMSYPKWEGNCPGVNCPGELSGGIVPHSSCSIDSFFILPIHAILIKFSRHQSSFLLPPSLGPCFAAMQDNWVIASILCLNIAG